MGELRKLRLGNAENVVTPYTAEDDSIIINETTRQVKVNPEVIATQDDLDDVKEDLSGLETRLKSGKTEDADLHLGFYLDTDGDLCQVDEEVANG